MIWESDISTKLQTLITLNPKASRTNRRWVFLLALVGLASGLGVRGGWVLGFFPVILTATNITADALWFEVSLRLWV